MLHDSKPHDEPPVDEWIVRVQGHAGEVEHRRNRTLPSRTHRHVEMTRAVCIRPRQDRLNPVAAANVRELMAAQTHARVVVMTALIRLPEIDSGSLHRLSPPPRGGAPPG